MKRLFFIILYVIVGITMHATVQTSKNIYSNLAVPMHSTNSVNQMFNHKPSNSQYQNTLPTNYSTATESTNLNIYSTAKTTLRATEKSVNNSYLNLGTTSANRQYSTTTSGSIAYHSQATNLTTANSSTWVNITTNAQTTNSLRPTAKSSLSVILRRAMNKGMEDPDNPGYYWDDEVEEYVQEGKSIGETDKYGRYWNGTNWQYEYVPATEVEFPTPIDDLPYWLLALLCIAFVCLKRRRAKHCALGTSVSD